MSIFRIKNGKCIQLQKPENPSKDTWVKDEFTDIGSDGPGISHKQHLLNHSRQNSSRGILILTSGTQGNTQSHKLES